MLIDAAWYLDGIRKESGTDFQYLLDRANSQGGFVWIGLAEPSDEEFHKIAEILNLHPLAVEDAVNAQQRPKLEDFGDQNFLIIKTVFFTDKSGNYSAIWRPYHYIGLELAQSMYVIAIDKRATGQTNYFNAGCLS